MSMLRRQERINNINSAERRLDDVIENLHEATSLVQEQANSLGDLTQRLSKLREALDSDGIKV